MGDFHERNKKLIDKMSQDDELKVLTRDWFARSSRYEYSYHFNWLGRPIIQFPQDIIAVQEIIWTVNPDLIVETGIAHGGSIIFSASMLELMGGDGHVVGIDIDIREHNRTAIESHPLFKRITMIEGSSTDDSVVEQVYELAKNKKRILVCLDSNHTHDHVLKEMQLYAPLVNAGSYLIVFDTVVEDMPESGISDRPWGKGNNPKTAVREFMKTSDRFQIDEEIQKKLLITVAPDGYLRCIKD